MWVEFILRCATFLVVGIIAYFIGHEIGRKDAEMKAKEKYEKDLDRWIDERCNLISEIIKLKDDSKHEHYLTD